MVLVPDLWQKRLANSSVMLKNETDGGGGSQIFFPKRVFARREVDW